ncbi:acyltransferase [Akkermansiaceae bacterium]|nr:acyltransferase [Akkermansiaceae bacterium]
MKTKFSILYSWLIRTTTYFLPNVQPVMRFRGFLYSLLMKRCGKNLQVTSSAYFNTLIGLQFGDNVYIAHNAIIISLDLTIGDDVLIGPNCVISGGDHILENGSFRFGASEITGVLIEKGAWVAANCTVVGGSKLPESSILAAGSVLTKQFEHIQSIYGGVPAKFIKKVKL